MPNKINPYSEFSLQVQSEVLLALNTQIQSTNELGKTLNRPYHTIRQAVLELENNGTIVAISRAYRNTKYKVADGTIINNRIIPTIKINDQDYKVSIIINNSYKPTRAEIAANNLPKHLTRIFKIAQRLALGDRAAELSLPLIKHEMEADRDALINLLNVYTQIIKNGKIWSPEHLANFPNDTEWNQESLDRAYIHHFGE